jgi:hypothetical protein
LNSWAGVPLTYEEYYGGLFYTGTVVIDFQNNKFDGTYECYGASPCQIAGEAWINDDTYCHKYRFEICTLVYLDGSAFYAVGTDGKVFAIDKRQ